MPNPRNLEWLRRELNLDEFFGNVLAHTAAADEEMSDTLVFYNHQATCFETTEPGVHYSSRDGDIRRPNWSGYLTISRWRPRYGGNNVHIMSGKPVYLDHNFLGMYDRTRNVFLTTDWVSNIDAEFARNLWPKLVRDLGLKRK